jgi:hypothetical protein
MASTRPISRERVDIVDRVQLTRIDAAAGRTRRCGSVLTACRRTRIRRLCIEDLTRQSCRGRIGCHSRELLFAGRPVREKHDQWPRASVRQIPGAADRPVQVNIEARRLAASARSFRFATPSHGKRHVRQAGLIANAN